MNLLAMTAKAIDVQDRFNALPRIRRFHAFYWHQRLMNRILHKYRLDCICTACESIMDSGREHKEGCSECGSADIVSEYYS